MSGKETNDIYTMESEVPFADCEVMKENVPEFTGMEKQLEDPQIFAFMGNKITKDSSPKSLQHTPLAPKNKNIGPS